MHVKQQQIRWEKQQIENNRFIPLQTNLAARLNINDKTRTALSEITVLLNRMSINFVCLFVC